LAIHCAATEYNGPSALDDDLFDMTQGAKNRRGNALLLWLPILIWTQLIAASAWWNVHSVNAQTTEIAAQRGRDLFTMIQLMREWNANHVGIYAIRSELAQPNPLLRTPNRDLETSEGLQLTLINAAYMTRQISELARRHRFHFRMTSVDPLRQGNAPDAWERRALEAFAGGTTERIELIGSESTSIYRYMAPLETEPECLGCHAIQGYQLGDVLGGISFDIDATALITARDERLITAAVAHLVVWLAVGTVLVGSQLGIRHKIQRLHLDRAAQARTIANKDRALKQAENKIHALQSGDSLTGFFNRGHFEKSLQEALDQSEARRQPFGLMTVELDYFKEFNEAYGQLEGDIVMRMAAEVIKARVPDDGSVLGRYIGASFAVAVADVEARRLQGIAESIRQGIYELGVKHEHSQAAKFVTVTIGATVRGSKQKFDAAALLKQAATAMYQGKSKGHNCVVVG